MTPDQAKLLAGFYDAEAIVTRNDEKWACWPKPLVEAHRALVQLSKTSSCVCYDGIGDCPIHGQLK